MLDNPPALFSTQIPGNSSHQCLLPEAFRISMTGPPTLADKFLEFVFGQSHTSPFRYTGYLHRHILNQ